MTKVKTQKSLPVRIAIALVAGITFGLACLYTREYMMANGQEQLWGTINRFLFQDITVEGGQNAIGLFYIIGQLFVKALQVVIVPMVFTSIALAIGKVADTKTLGRISFKTLGWFLMTSTTALVLACIVGIFFFNQDVFSANITGLEQSVGSTGQNPLLVILNIIPSNIIATFSSNSAVLSIVFLAVSVGLAMSYLGHEKTSTLEKIMVEINEIVIVFLNFVVTKFAPFAIFVLLSRTFASYGIDYLIPALAYVVITVGLLLVFLFIGYPLLVWIGTGLNPLIFVKKILNVVIFGFSTSSSAATLPLNLETNIKRLGVSEEVASFVLPLGMTVNMDGTAIMQVIATVFIAGNAGYDVTLTSLVVIAVLALIASAGTPAAPGAGAVILFTILSGVGYTNDAALLAYSLILAINRPIEMLVTSLNVVGDSTACLYVAKGENKLDLDVYNNQDL